MTMATKKTPAKPSKPAPKPAAKPAAKSAAKRPATPTKKSTSKKLPGKSNVIAQAEVYKPSIYLDDNQIPKELKGAKVGDTVKLEVTGKIVRRSETQEPGKVSNSVSIEMENIKSAGKKGK